MRVLLGLLFAAAAMAAMPQAADARDGCGPGYYYNGFGVVGAAFISR
jgi:hypothetical protein